MHLGTSVLGRVINIDKPYLLNARKQLHAGFIPPGASTESRVVLVAFDSINIGSLSVGVLEELHFTRLGSGSIRNQTSVRRSLRGPCWLWTYKPGYNYLSLRFFVELSRDL